LATISHPAYAAPWVPPGHEVVVIVNAPPDAPTLTFAEDVAEPEALVAVSVYVVVAVGVTLVDPLAEVDVNVPGVIAILAAPLVAQLSVALAPEVMLVGFAVKELIAGPELFPDDEFDELVPQPSSAAPASRIRPSVQRRRPEELIPRELIAFLQSHSHVLMHNPFVAVRDR
jgi:hypothetical protein